MAGMDKVAHFFMYGGLVLLLRWALAGHWHFRLTPWVVIASAAGYGLAMEIAQSLFVPYDRCFEAGDVAANTVGAVTFWWVGALMFVTRNPSPAAVNTDSSAVPLSEPIPVTGVLQVQPPKPGTGSALRRPHSSCSPLKPQRSAEVSSSPPSTKSPPLASAKSNGLRGWLLPALPFALLWLVLINQLRVEWAISPQYAYGVAVPFLCAYLLWQRFPKKKDGISHASLPSPLSPLAPPTPLSAFRFPLSAFLFLAFLLLPIRLVQEANPQWGLTNWLVAGDVVGLTLLAGRIVFGPQQWKQFAFPICYFLVAVPWPMLIEYPLIQGLTRANVATSIELMNWGGLPAMQHGNTIEISTGVLGIDEACSGIRSFQATLMISLFLGELHRLSLLRRVLFCLSGFVMSFVFNMARTMLLAIVASQKGIGAIAQWHDPAGVTILVGCFAGLWGLGTVLKNRRPATVPTASDSPPPVQPTFPLSAFRFPLFSFFLLWVLLVVGGVELWFRSHEGGLVKASTWTIQLPRDNPTIKQTPLAENQRRSLRYDECLQATWQEAGPLTWHIIHMIWKPGRVAAHQAQGHMPEGCMAAAGQQVTILDKMEWLETKGLRLPFRSYEIIDQGKRFFLFYCVWQDYPRKQEFERQDIQSWAARLENVFAGRRNLGQRTLEIAVGGVDDAQQARAAFQRQVKSLIKVEKQSDGF